MTGTVSDGSTSVNFITHFTIWVLTGSGAPTPTAKTAYAGPERLADLVEPEGDGRDGRRPIVPTAPGDGLIITMAPLNPAAVGAAARHDLVGNAAVRSRSPPTRSSPTRR